MSRPRRALVALAAVTLLATTAPAGAVVSEPVRLALATLDQGRAPAVAYVEGTTLVDGASRIELPGTRARLLGGVGEDHLVGTYTDLDDQDVLRVSPDGTHRVLLEGVDLWEVTASEDGERLVRARGGRNRTRLVVHDTTTGAPLASRRVPQAYAQVLAADATRVVFSSGGPGAVGTWVWQTGSGAVQRLVGRRSYRVDLGHDLLAFYDKDPYLGGCSLLTRISDRRRTLWRSCTERIDTISPDGRRVTTIDLLSDGIGPARTWLRTVTGHKRGSYDAPAYFGLVTWEDADTFLIETHNRRKAALVRCTGRACELGTAPRRAPMPRSRLRSPAR